jgi:hypothetical protein
MSLRKETVNDMSKEYELKKQMDEIIDCAYAGNSKLKEMHWFKIILKPDSKVRTRLGDYNPRTKIIRLFFTKYGEMNNVLTVLHEVAHHVDYTLNQKTGHQKPFYEAYRKLLYAAFDLGKISVTEVKKMKRQEQDYNKVMKIVENYVPNRSIKENVADDRERISVMNAYSLKDTLKDKGYHWDSVLKGWFWIADDEQAMQAEIAKLHELGITDENIFVRKENELSMKRPEYDKEERRYVLK